MHLPRLMIAAPKSNSGKTMLTCVLLELLKKQGKEIFSVKAGPDYIDPLFHETVQGVRCFNLDTFFTDRQATNGLLYEDMITACCMSGNSDIAVCEKKIESSVKPNVNNGIVDNEKSNGKNNTNDGHFDGKNQFMENGKEGALPYCLMEGVMGLYDGIGGVEICGSSYELAQWTETPIVLVVDAKGAGRSLLATVAGMREMDADGLIRGVVLNRIGEGFYPRMKELIEAELQISVLGFLPEREELAIESRYLGLVLPDEIADLKQRIRKAAEIAENTIHIEEICRIMESAGEKNFKIKKTNIQATTAANLTKVNDAQPNPRKSTLNLAIAQDEAFCFYYRENLRMFERAGFRLVPFLPMRDAELPEDTYALLLGGGYPELYAAELSQNRTMRESIKAAIQSGMPTIAECGGFLYLHERLSDKDGAEYPMCGIVHAGAVYRKRSVRFGYIIIEETQSGCAIRGHEFHHYESEDCGSDLTATRPYDGSRYRTGHLAAGQYFGFPHLYLPSALAFVQSFRREAERYANGK